MTSFEDITVSTRTFTASTNLTIDIAKLFEIVPITPYIVVSKKRGRKRNPPNPDPNIDISYGSIITARYENKMKGVDTKARHTNTKRVKWFRNSITFVIVFDKHINFKVCRNGTFQMTGCKTSKHVELCIKALWDILKLHQGLYEIINGPAINVLIIPSMRNIDFSLGFTVDREKLNAYMIKQSDSRCLLETSFGYTGVNIKFQLTKDLALMNIRKLTCNPVDGIWSSSMTTYSEHLDGLSEKARNAKLKNPRYNTFLVFHSGKVIMSGVSAEYMKDVYYDFREMISASRDEIEEKLFL